jgi:hypothetical protein
MKTLRGNRQDLQDLSESNSIHRDPERSCKSCLFLLFQAVVKDNK